MGACFSSIYDVAIGDVAPAEAGSASGALSAVQQLAAAIGSAVVTTVYFSQRRAGLGPAERAAPLGDPGRNPSQSARADTRPGRSRPRRDGEPDTYRVLEDPSRPGGRTWLIRASPASP